MDVAVNIPMLVWKKFTHSPHLLSRRITWRW